MERELCLYRIFSVQLTLDFGKSLPADQSFKSILSRPAATMDTALDKILGHQKKAYSAIIVVWTVTEPNLEKLARDLADDILKPKFADKILSFNTTLGLQAQGFNRTIEVSQFSGWRRVAPLGEALSLDPDFDAPDDQGLQIKLDVNTKPSVDNPHKGAFSSIIPIFVQSITDDLPPLVTPNLVAALPK
jgi:hypothetical protein